MLGGGGALMTTLPVNEIFPTIQGEATFTGTPSVFIRLQGCDVGCPWCDTKHTWAKEFVYKVTPAQMLAKRGDGPQWANLTPEAICAAAATHEPRHVVITGGEPCDHDLTELTEALERGGSTVQIETSGTAEIRAATETWVTLSPKIGMPGGRTVRKDAVQRADEIKMPVGKEDDIIALVAFLAFHRNSDCKRIWLQPLSQSVKATNLCIRAAHRHGWRLSLQTHKVLGVR